MKSVTRLLSAAALTLRPRTWYNYRVAMNAPPPEKQKPLAAAVAELSKLLTRDRERLPAAYLKDRRLREAYRTYYLPPNLLKMRLPLAELALHPDGLFDKDALRVLDLGSGPGTSLLGTLDYFAAGQKRPALECTAVDQVAENLDVARELFSARREELGIAASLAVVQSGVEGCLSMSGRPFDLIILSNVLNELHRGDGARVRKRALLLASIAEKLLAPDGSIVIIEPALRGTSRELLEVRDLLVSEGVSVYTPCICRAACPALANPNDWCHEDLPWDAPAIIRELDRMTGLRKESLKFSWLVLRRDTRSLADVHGGTAFRVVSEPLVSKGKLEFYVCGHRGRKLVMRQDKDKTDANKAFGSLLRGDILNCAGMVDEGKRYRIGKETEVSLLLSSQLRFRVL